MPNLRTWQLFHPSKWTQDQAEAYVQDTAAALTVGISPVTMAVGPLAACNILLSVIYQIARHNPMLIDQILDSMAQCSEQMVIVDPFDKKVVN